MTILNETTIPDPPVLPRPVQSFFEQYPVVREWLAGGAVPTKDLVAETRQMLADQERHFNPAGRCTR